MYFYCILAKSLALWKPRTTQAILGRTLIIMCICTCTNIILDVLTVDDSNEYCIICALTLNSFLQCWAGNLWWPTYLPYSSEYHTVVLHAFRCAQKFHFGGCGIQSLCCAYTAVYFLRIEWCWLVTWEGRRCRVLKEKCVSVLCAWSIEPKASVMLKSTVLLSVLPLSKCLSTCTCILHMYMCT